jgi:UDP-N-acetylglucosamine 2-epimerase (hydrolysing)
MFVKKKIVFITGTRADYGKIKSIINITKKKFNCYIYVTGMHMLPKYGNTYIQVLSENKKDARIHLYKNQPSKKNQSQSITLSKTIMDFTKFLEKVNPDLLLIHGDRFDAIAAALTGSANNLLVAHVEGGEISGNIDEHLRHAISKLSHLHFVATSEAKKNLIQLGEKTHTIFNVGSPDIDVMLSKQLPKIDHVKKRYKINMCEYSIAIFHPIFFENNTTFKKNVDIFIKSLILSKKKYIVIYPNNDYGNEIIINSYLKKLKNKKHFKIIKSLRFEYFLTLLKFSNFIIGNSSAGVREAPIYGIPTINIGDRQSNRFFHVSIKNVPFDISVILKTIRKIDGKKFKKTKYFGKGNSAKLIFKILSNAKIWKMNKQKQLVIQDM